MLYNILGLHCIMCKVADLLAVKYLTAFFSLVNLTFASILRLRLSNDISNQIGMSVHQVWVTLAPYNEFLSNSKHAFHSLKYCRQRDDAP